MRMKAPKEGPCDPIAPLELPHALHAFQRVSDTDSLNQVFYLYTILMYLQVHAFIANVQEAPAKVILCGYYIQFLSA